VPGPASLEFRCLPALDARAFLQGYGIPEEGVESAIWLGLFFEAMYEGLAMIIEDGFLKPPRPQAIAVYPRQFRALMKRLEFSRPFGKGAL
jgi:hypothetical protein